MSYLKADEMRTVKHETYDSTNDDKVRVYLGSQKPVQVTVEKSSLANDSYDTVLFNKQILIAQTDQLKKLKEV